jgi:hypothetical protein
MPKDKKPGILIASRELILNATGSIPVAVPSNSPEKRRNRFEKDMSISKSA